MTPPTLQNMSEKRKFTLINSTQHVISLNENTNILAQFVLLDNPGIIIWQFVAQSMMTIKMATFLFKDNMS